MIYMHDFTKVYFPENQQNNDKFENTWWTETNRPYIIAKYYTQNTPL